MIVSPLQDSLSLLFNRTLTDIKPLVGPLSTTVPLKTMSKEKGYAFLLGLSYSSWVQDYFEACKQATSLLMGFCI